MRPIHSIEELEPFKNMFVTVQVASDLDFHQPLFQQIPQVDGSFVAYLSKENAGYRVSVLRGSTTESQKPELAPYINHNDIERSHSKLVRNPISIGRATTRELERAHRWVSQETAGMSFDTVDYQRNKGPNYSNELDHTIKDLLNTELFGTPVTPNPFSSPKITRRSDPS